MYRDEKLEMKVGLFIGIGIAVMFLIIFSIKDISMLGEGYEFEAGFDFINGIKASSPVRLAGVDVGEVRKVDLFYNEELKRTQVKLTMWVRQDVKIEKDASLRINTLGLLGERYVEVTPGVSSEFIVGGDHVRGRNPMNVGRQMEQMNALAVALSRIVRHVEEGKGTLGRLIMDDSLYNNLDSLVGGLEKGEGTLGKLIKDDRLYNDLEVVIRRLRDGEGTIGKLLADEKIYNDAEDLVSDVKAHPWKLLHKTRERTKDR